MFKTVHLAALTVPLAAVIAWPGQAPLVVSVPVVLTAVATLGVGALATLRECWTSLVGDGSQRLLLRLRWAVWMRQPADCSALAKVLVDRVGVTFDPQSAAERTALVGLMFNLRRMNARHAGALGTPLTSHELARQLWAVAPEHATERGPWLRLAEESFAQAADVDMAEGAVARLIRLRNKLLGAMFWGGSRARLAARYDAFGGREVAAIPLAEVTPFGLAGHRDPRAALLHAATTGALKENDVDPRTEGLGALPLTIQARLVSLLLLLEDAPLARLRAWSIASGAMTQLLNLRSIAARAEALDPQALDSTAYEGPAVADGLFDAMAGRERAAESSATGPEAFALGTQARQAASVTSLDEARAARLPDLDPATDLATRGDGGLLRAPIAAGRRMLRRVNTSLARVQPVPETETWETPAEAVSAARAPVPTGPGSAGVISAGPVPAAPISTVAEPRAEDSARTAAMRPGGARPLRVAPRSVSPAADVAPRSAAATAAQPCLDDAARGAARALAQQANRPPVAVPVAPPVSAPAVGPDSTPDCPADRVSDAALPSLYLRRVWQPGQVLHTAGGQLGGVPALPRDVAWPRHGDRGEPLHFLAHIDCMSAHQAGRMQDVLPDLPAEGRLLFFADVSVRDTDGPVDVAVLYLTATQVAQATPAALPADLPDVDHAARTALPLSDRPGQRVFPRFAVDLFEILTEPGEGAGQDRTQHAIAQHLPPPDAARKPRLFQRIPDAERAVSGGYWHYDETILGPSFPATAAMARATFAAIAGHAARNRARCAAHARLTDGPDAAENTALTTRMAWLDALAASADILRARLPEAGSAQDGPLPAAERARMRAWLRVIGHRNPQAGPVAEAAIRDVLQKQAIRGIEDPEMAEGLGHAALAFVAPALRPTVEDADHRLGGAACTDDADQMGKEKLLQLDSDPALGFRFIDHGGLSGKLEIWVPTDRPFPERLAHAVAQVVPG